MKREITNLTSQSGTEWAQFAKEKFYSLNVTSLEPKFSGCIDIVRFENDFRFAKIKSSAQEVKTSYDKEKDFFYVILSSGAMTWDNDTKHGALRNGGIVVFDCNRPVKYKFMGERNTTSFLLPYSYFKEGSAIDSIRKGGVITYSSIIKDIMVGAKSNDELIYQKLDSVASLLTLRNIDKRDSTSNFDIISGYIDRNVLNGKYSLHDLARDTCFSTRKIQGILTERGLTFKGMLNLSRVERLAHGLENSDEKIIKLCTDSGFNSRANACSQFKLIKGVSVIEYREQLKNMS